MLGSAEKRLGDDQRQHPRHKRKGNTMRIAATLVFAGALSLVAAGAAWSQTAAPNSFAAAQPAAVPAPVAAPAAAKMPCANPDALGIGRVVEIDTTGGPGFASSISSSSIS